jgi:hypothetical protein
MLAAFTYPGFHGFHWASESGTFLQVSALDAHWLEECANFTPTLEKNGGKKQRQPLLVQYKQQANPLLSMHNYTPHVISGNDKNKQLTLLSQCKLTFNSSLGRYVFGSEISYNKAPPRLPGLGC